MALLREEQSDNQTCTLALATFFTALFTSTVNKKEASVNVNLDIEYDFIIVGGGTAGCVVSSRLSEVDDWKILLIEAGPEEPQITQIPSFMAYTDNLDNDIKMSYKMEPNEYCYRKGCKMSEAKVLGGGSTINYMFYYRGYKTDYDGWYMMGNTEWSYNKVLKYFKKLESNREYGNDTEYHGNNGPLNVEEMPYIDKVSRKIIEAFQELGIEEQDLNRNEEEGVSVIQTTSKNGIRQSTNIAYLKYARQLKKNLHVITEATVTKVLIDENMVAYGVEFEKDGRKEEVRATKEVILSAGVFESPHILMLSGVGPPDILKESGINVIKDLNVGQNYQNHYYSTPIKFILNDESLIPSSFAQVSKDLFQYLFSSGPIASIGVFSAQGTVESNLASEDNGRPDILFVFAPIVLNTSESAAIEQQKQCQAFPNDTLLPLSYYNGFLATSNTLKSYGRGHVALNTSDPNGKLLIFDNMLHPNDFEILVDRVNFLRRLAKTQVFLDSGFKIEPFSFSECLSEKFDTDSYWRCMTKLYAMPIYHGVGTCKMGPSFDKYAVVNSTLQVYGLSGLRVINASIMPEIIGATTNVPTIMIAEMGSDMIKESWLWPEN